MDQHVRDVALCQKQTSREGAKIGYRLPENGDLGDALLGSRPARVVCLLTGEGP